MLTHRTARPPSLQGTRAFAPGALAPQLPLPPPVQAFCIRAPADAVQSPGGILARARKRDAIAARWAEKAKRLTPEQQARKAARRHQRSDERVGAVLLANNVVENFSSDVHGSPELHQVTPLEVRMSVPARESMHSLGAAKDRLGEACRAEPD